MANKGLALTRPVWIKQAEDAKFKEEEEKTAAAKAAFDATFNDLHDNDACSSDDEPDEALKLASRPIGPVAPAKCMAAGTGVGGGAAGSVASFVVVTKDSDGRRMSYGGAHLRVRITSDAAAGGVEQEAVVKDHADGTYTVTYAVAKRGNYMVSVECNGQPIQGSPFPVFFSGANGSSPNGVLPASGNIVGSSSFGSLPSFSSAMPGLFSGMLGMIPGLLPGASGGAILPGLAASFGEVCRDYLNGKCVRTDCKFNHPPLQQLMNALSSGSTMGGLSQMPMAPSAAAMAAAQSIVAAQAYQAAQARAAVQQQESAVSKENNKVSNSPAGKEKSDALSHTLKISNISPLLTAEQLRQLFSYFGTVTDCEIADSKQLAYVEYVKSEEAKAALGLNNMEVGGRPLNVEIAQSVRGRKPSSDSSATTNSSEPPPLPVMMQQAVAMQQLQFQQALIMQQAMASQQAAARAASVKSATEMSAVRAAEISKTLKVDGDGQADKEPRRSRSPSRSRAHSRSKSCSPLKYRHEGNLRSFSRPPPARFHRGRRSRSRSRERTYYGRGRRDHFLYNRGARRGYSHHYGRHDNRWERERVHESSSSRRNRSRSKERSQHSESPRYRKEGRSWSPRHRREESGRHLQHSRSPSRGSESKSDSFKKER